MIDLAKIPVPQRMRKLPVYQGMRVPWATFIDPVTKIPDFRTHDERRRQRCVLHRLCAMCGEKVGQKIAFIGGPGSIEHSQLFMDAGMHPACAKYAWTTCPYIVYGKGHAKHRDRDYSVPVVVQQFRDIPTDPMERMGMMITESYTIVDYHGAPVVRAGKAESIEWRTYP